MTDPLDGEESDEGPTPNPESDSALAESEADPEQEAPPTEPTEPGPVTRVLDHAVAAIRWLPLAAVLGFAPGWFLWPWLHEEQADYVATNQLPMGDRTSILAWMIGGLVVLGGAYGGLWIRHRNQSSEPGSIHAFFASLNGRALGLLALPLLPILSVPKLESERPLLMLAVAALIGVIVAIWFYHLAPTLGRAHEALERPGPRIPTLAAAVVVTVMAVAYAVLLSRWSIMVHHQLATRVYDLGIYENTIWNSAHGSFLRCTFIKSGTHASAHFDPILILISPLYMLNPEAETLLVFQSVWLAAGVAPCFLLAVHRKRPWLGVALSAVYLLHPALHGMNMYMFHSLTLVGPLLLWLIYAFESRRFRLYFVVLALVLLTREDMALLSCFVGAYLVWTGHRRVGVVTIGVALVWFVVVKTLFMVDPSIFMEQGSKSYGYAKYYAELIPEPKAGAKGLFLSVFTNPQFLVQHVFTEAKVLFMLQMAVPLLGLPLLARKRAFLLLYGALFILLASKEPVFTIRFQYPAVLLPFMVGIIPGALERLTDTEWPKAWRLEGARLWAALPAGALAASLVVSHEFGVLWENEVFRGGFATLNRSPSEEIEERYAQLRAIVDSIPRDASVSASKTPGAHVAGRDTAYMFPKHEKADYLLIYKRDLKPDHRKKLKRLRKKRYVRTQQGMGFELYERKPN